MKKILKTVLLLFVINIVAHNVFAQHPGKYYYMKLNKQIIADALADAHFTKFVFRYKTYDKKNYVLEGVAIYDNDDIKNVPFDLVTVTALPPENIKSHFRGVISLDVPTMKDPLNQINGTFDLYFNPRQFKDGQGNTKFFVSYLLDKTAHKEVPDEGKKSAFFPPTGLTLNPSPPRNS